MFSLLHLELARSKERDLERRLEHFAEASEARLDARTECGLGSETFQAALADFLRAEDLGAGVSSVRRRAPEVVGNGICLAEWGQGQSCA